MKKTALSFLSAFTLIELLVVITIIGVLSTMILNAGRGVQNKSYRARAQAEISAMGSALESFKADMGDYPTGSNVASVSANNNYLLTNLMPSVNKVYFEFKRGMTNASGNIVDPWAQAYGYCYPGSVDRSGTNFFDLWSQAGSANTNSWIKNW